DCASKRLRIRVFYCSSDSVTEVPCGFVADPHHALDLIRTHALAGLTEQVSSSEPFNQRQMGVMEDRSRCYAELITAVIAVELVAIVDAGNLRGLATGTGDFIRPAQCLKVFAALVIAAILFQQFTKIDRGCHVCS